MTPVRWLAAFALVVLLGCAGGGATGTQRQASTTPTTAAGPTTTATPERVELAGGGDGNTEPFALRGGRYKLTYEYGGDCYYSASLRTTQDAAADDLPTGNGPISGDGNLFGVEAGDYFLNMITGPAPGCPWKVVITSA